MDKKAMYKLTYGLFVVTSPDEANGRLNGCINNTAIQVASDPNQIGICINKANYSHDLVLNAHKFNISVIGTDADFELFKRFGFQSGRDVDKFADFSDYKLSGNGLPYITKGTNAFFSVWVDKVLDLGSHTFFAGQVTDMEVLSDVGSCSYEFYQNNIKPKPQEKTAEEKGKTIWRCKICGYEYEGEELPEGFICPICKHPADDFEKIS